MRIIKGENVWNVSAQIGAKNKDHIYVNRRSSYDKNNYVVDDQDYQDFLKAYNDIFTTEQKIDPKDVIYFFKESKYPRFKFSANCSNPKTIKIEKADKIVTPQLSDRNYYDKYRYIIIKDALTENLYLLNCDYNHNTSRILADIHNLYKQATPEDSFVEALRDKFLIQGNNYEIINNVKIFGLTSNHNVSDDFLDNLINNIDKCISEESLEKYVSKDSTTLDKEMQESINTMLSSTDAGTIELGIKMLSNFSVEKSSFRLGMLIRSNAENIMTNKACNSAGFKNVLSQLNFNMQNIRYMDTLAYLNQLYENSAEDYKEEIREATVMEMLRRVNTHFLGQSNIVKSMGVILKAEVV